eukprot:gb/GECG01012999.1/.p1 GENE.gb/GECG01012999.1/~~gb/GECG01012999.1/.p1  ORF type:complete len:526 (+),score=33.14 gb/GECG01012999.1/:1-1578(+)
MDHYGYTDMDREFHLDDHNDSLVPHPPPAQRDESPRRANGCRTPPVSRKPRTALSFHTPARKIDVSHRGRSLSRELASASSVYPGSPFSPRSAEPSTPRLNTQTNTGYFEGSHLQSPQQGTDPRPATASSASSYGDNRESDLSTDSHSQCVDPLSSSPYHHASGMEAERANEATQIQRHNRFSSNSASSNSTFGGKKGLRGRAQTRAKLRSCSMDYTGLCLEDEQASATHPSRSFSFKIRKALRKNRHRQNNNPNISALDLAETQPIATPKDQFLFWHKISQGVQIHIASFLNLKDILQLSGASKTMLMLARANAIWRPLYVQRFNVEPLTHDFYERYRERVLSPERGDQVEVCWKGSFNLVNGNSTVAYRGLAWWTAFIIDKDEDEDIYLVHYEMWDESTWDEWVPRDRIRWPPRQESHFEPLEAGDGVELKCTSSYGRSPWLVTEIARRLNGANYIVGKEMLTDSAVPREKLRLVRRARKLPKGQRLKKFVSRRFRRIDWNQDPYTSSNAQPQRVHSERCSIL